MAFIQITSSCCCCCCCCGCCWVQEASSHFYQSFCLFTEIITVLLLHFIYFDIKISLFWTSVKRECVCVSVYLCVCVLTENQQHDVKQHEYEIARWESEKRENVAECKCL
jgi:hypothetical protein